ncbi:oxygenase [Lithospermum erythrorhizon]|uniref:Oxygenase n=1 Tax=Lithospermum erythrorhizon TaxID=34254 RepID=A0AAV3RAG5_LITER
MEAMQMLKASSFPSFYSSYAKPFSKSKPPSNLCVQTNELKKTCILTCSKSCKKEGRFLNLPSAASTFSTATTEADQETIFTTKTDNEPKVSEEKFDWYDQWYPIMPLCDLDKRRPHGKKVMGIDVVAWWDKNDEQWKVFDDRCPHRLAPLSEGRIDPSGRLQCVYHGWCFGGAGDCKFIPQAPGDGPQVHTSKKACVGVYPSYVQNGILWFWPSTDAQYKHIILEKKPPYVPELDDPSYTRPEEFLTRDLPYGYEVLIENLMDPSHAPYAHYTIMKVWEPPTR